MVNLKIDGKNVQIEKGATILTAATKAGVKIPTLCFLQKVSPTGACRICVVDIAGVAKPMTACNTPVVEGMEVTTQSPRLEVIRRQVVELLLVNHPLDCPVCDAAGECDLQNICYDLDVTRQPFAAEDVNAPVIDGWPLIQQVPSRCVLCEKCVKVCHETIGSSALFINDKGDRAFIDKDLSLCEYCGNCVSVCPTGTMISKPFKFKARPWELTKVPSVCTHCSSHCQVELNVKQGKVLRITSADGVTVNDGNLCIGGSFSYDYINSSQRLSRPLVKRGNQQTAVSWDEALTVAAEGLRKAGSDAVAGLASPRLSNEENYLFQKLFRVTLGSNNIDSEARFGALRGLQVLNATLGLRGASNRIDRIGHAGAVLVFGADVTAEAPALDWQIELACRKRDGLLVVANMRKVKLSRYANTQLNYRPGSEVALALALSRVLLDSGLLAKDYLNQYVGNVEEIETHLRGIDLAAAVAQTGLPLELIEEAALSLGQADSVAILFGGDVVKGDQAEATVAALANLALLCGALHGDVGGLFPIDEKGNMQGLLDMGVYPESLPGYQPYASAATKFETAWGVKLPKGGRNALEILTGIEQGSIKALYLAAANPLTFPEAGRWRQALAKLELLVVQDILPSEITELAHVVLPGSSFAEKSGSVTALDGRVSCLAQAIKPVGEAREDWEILAALYNRLAARDGQIQPQQLLGEAKGLTELYGDICFAGTGRCQPCLRTPFRPEKKSLTYSTLDLPALAPAGLQLLSGKLLFHFGTTTTFAAGPLQVAPCGYVEIHPEDAARAGLVEGVQVKLSSTLGSIQGPLRLSENVPPGLLFAPHHFAGLNVQSLLPAGQNRVAVQISKA